ncbi:MAG: O-antigen ligase family protein [Gammaproteobacteria bacterium]|nr:O-antigen ligase family protein [Gammaproteobacteria bacterium]
MNKQIELAMFILLGLLVILIPIPYGSNRPWALALIETSVFLLASFVILNNAINRNTSTPSSDHIKNLIYLFLTWVTYQVTMVIPIPIDLLQILSEQRYENHFATFPNSTNKYLSLSYDQYTSVKTLISNLTFIAIFFATYHLVNTQQRLKILLWIFVVSGLGQALYGIIEMYNFQHSVGANTFVTSSHTISGSFINRNHFSSFIIFAIAATSSLIMISSHSKTFETNPSFFKSIMSKFLDYRFHLKLYLFVFISALLYSQSRGAELGLIFALIFGLVVFLFNRRNKINKIHKLLIFFLPVALFVAYMANEGWLNRFQFIVDNAPQRLIIWETSLEIFYDYWLTGVGPGNYQYLYPMYQQFGAEYFVDHAHNDPLELLVEQGIIGMILLALPLFYIMLILARHIVKNRSITTIATQISTLVVVTAVLLHSFVDFIFQIPALAIYFYMFLALALRASRE